MWFLAWRNSSRRKGQSVLTIGITALTIFTFVLIIVVFSTVQSSLQLSTNRLGADLIVLPNKAEVDSFQTVFTAKPSNHYMKRDLLNNFAGIAGIEQMTTQFYTQTLNESCCSVGVEMRLVGYDPESDFILAPWFVTQKKSSLADDEILVGARVQGWLGNRTRLLGENFTVVGQLGATGSGMDETTFVNIATARRLAANSQYLQHLWTENSPDELISSVLIKVDTKHQAIDIAKAINKMQLPVRAYATGDLVSSIRKQIEAIQQVVIGIWLALLMVAALALIGRFTALARERKKEIGLLRAIGGQKTSVFGLVILESGILAGTGGLLGSVAGVLAASPLLKLLEQSLQLPVTQWSLSSALLCALWGLILALILGLASSAYPAWRSSAVSPQETLSRGELD
ncbi:MAG: FtsX-like permease family protein [Syntrophomonadaceae bacterium]|nr:FtsX-like permease family protein [Syntrophomonadaceae bacterium]